MTREELITASRESGLEYYGLGKDRERFIAHITRFAAFVRADEREACAKVCDELNFIDNGTPANTRATNRHCAAAIRARGNT